MSQLNFFLTEDEIASKIQTILTMGSFVVFNGKAFDNPQPNPISDVTETTDFQFLVLWLKNNSKNPSASINGEGELVDRFLFDYLKDPIIEIKNCRYTEGLFTAGRVYFKAGWIEDEELRNMHRKAGNQLLRLFYKGTTRLQKLWRVSPEVKKLVMQGAELELGRNGFRINEANINTA